MYFYLRFSSRVVEWVESKAEILLKGNLILPKQDMSLDLEIRLNTRGVHSENHIHVERVESTVV